jgi:hypothetical protein
MRRIGWRHEELPGVFGEAPPLDADECIDGIAHGRVQERLEESLGFSHLLHERRRNSFPRGRVQGVDAEPPSRFAPDAISNAARGVAIDRLSQARQAVSLELAL